MNMDHSTKARNLLVFVEELTKLFDKYPVGVASAYSALNKRLTNEASRLNGDLSTEVVRQTVDLRKMIGKKFDSANGDYRKRLQVYRNNRPSEYFRQRGDVACHLLGGLKPEPFQDENNVTIEELVWIIDCLTEARPAFSLDMHNSSERRKFQPELREAYALHLALSGAPKEEDECKYLSILELVIARLIGSVPSTILLGFWRSLKPKNSATISLHATVEDVLINLPPQEVRITDYIESGLLMLVALAETAEAACKDWEIRALFAEVTEYIQQSSGQAKQSISDYIAIAERQNLDLSLWKNRCYTAINQIDEYLEKATRTKICKHYSLSSFALSAYADNYAAAGDRTLYATLLVRC